MPVLTDGRVTLRAHTESDLDLVHEMTRDPETLRWTAIPFDNTREDSRRFVIELLAEGWEKHNHRGWAIEAIDDAGDAKFAGNIDVRGAPIADVGWVLHPWARGRGIMRAAIRLAANWVFTEGGVEIIHWRAHVGNVTSARTASAAGFTLHATTPGILDERGQVLDAWTASIRFGDGPRPKHPAREIARLAGDSIQLRPFADKDATRIASACSDTRTRHWIAGLPSPYTEATARAYIADMAWNAMTGKAVTWAIADQKSDVLVGNISVMDLAGLDPTSGEIGYWIHPDTRGHGLMRQAIRCVIAHAFTSPDHGGLGLRRLSLFAAAGNASSNAVACGAGFSPTGVQRAAEPLGDGTFDDLHSYDLLADDHTN